MAAAAVTVNKRIPTTIPKLEIVDITTATTGDWFVSEKFMAVAAAHLTYKTTQATTDATYCTITAPNTVVLNLVGTTTGSGWLFVNGY